jgi:hypothetical protein
MKPSTNELEASCRAVAHAFRCHGACRTCPAVVHRLDGLVTHISLFVRHVSMLPRPCRSETFTPPARTQRRPMHIPRTMHLIHDRRSCRTRSGAPAAALRSGTPRPAAACAGACQMCAPQLHSCCWTPARVSIPHESGFAARNGASVSITRDAVASVILWRQRAETTADQGAACLSYNIKSNRIVS